MNNNQKTATTAAADKVQNAAARTNASNKEINNLIAIREKYLEIYENWETLSQIVEHNSSLYNCKKYHAISLELDNIGKEYEKALFAIKGKLIPVTFENIHERSCAVAYTALKNTTLGSKIKKTKDGKIKGGANSGANKFLMRLRWEACSAISNAQTETAYIKRNVNDFDDIVQEASLSFVNSILNGEEQNDIYKNAFLVCRKWIWANRERPAAKHTYINEWNDDVKGIQIVDVTSGYAHMVNHVEEYEALNNIKNALTNNQWQALVFVGKGYTAKQIADKMNVTTMAVDSYIRKGRAAAKRLYPNVDSYSCFCFDDILAFTALK